MKYNININQIKCLEYGINMQQGAILDLIGKASTWAEGININGEIFYYISAKKIIDEYPLITDKKNTALGYIKVLLDREILKREIQENKSYYKLTRIGIDFFNQSVEKNQEGCGKKSTHCVEKNQDNNNTSYNNTIYNNSKELTTFVVEEFGNKEINKMQEFIRAQVSNLGFIYKTGKQERNRIKNILTGKEINGIAKKYNMSIYDFVGNIILLSSKLDFRNGKITNAENFYKHYDKIYNEGKKIKEQQQKRFIDYGDNFEESFIY